MLGFNKKIKLNLMKFFLLRYYNLLSIISAISKSEIKKYIWKKKTNLVNKKIYHLYKQI